LTAQNETFLLTGQSAGLRADRLLSAGQGAFVLTGHDMRLIIATMLQMIATRTYIVPAEIRMFAVGADERLTIVQTENRNFVVPAEDRTNLIEV